MDAVVMKQIVKQYPLVTAVDHADFCVEKGEIHSLLGENGAGKSTLMKILYGMTRPDEGKIWINGTEQVIKNPYHAIQLGIGMVHQHFMLTQVMTVTENIVVGNEPVKGITFDYKTAVKKVSEMIDQYGFHISPVAKVSDLSVGEQQRVEILKALYRGADILILDEPTAVLTPQEVEELFHVMRKLKGEGKSIVIITHKLKETMEIADRISVLRDGRMVKQGLSLEGLGTGDLAKLMVGRDVDLAIMRENPGIGKEYLKISDLTLLDRNQKKVLDHINITVHKGEIYGIAGIEGNGQTELIEVLTGLRKPDEGTIAKEGTPVSGNADQFLRRGIGHIPEDRMTRGLILDMTIEENIILGYHRDPKFSSGSGLLKTGEIRQYSEDMAETYKIKSSGTKALIRSLSGGNQQKVVIARVFSEDPDIIIVAQPTRGVDVGAMEYIHNKLLDFRDAGKAILLISADLDEVRCLSDRIGVIYDGKIEKEFAAGEASETELGLWMTGGTRGKEGKQLEA